ncbi:unnamed protein product [Amoebophrya sp. A25]|nr:unnamed protein product [Amoebophrya sp. A25]|eukprot:GSA25T00023377001.1
MGPNFLSPVIRILYLSASSELLRQPATAADYGPTRCSW